MNTKCIKENHRSRLSFIKRIQLDFLGRREKVTNTTILIFVIIVLSCATSLICKKVDDITHETNICPSLIKIIILSILIIYFLIAVLHTLKGKSLLKLFVPMLTILVLYFGLFASFEVYRAFQPSPSIPHLPGGTVGLRTYDCAVSFSNIKISFLDNNNIWQQIPDKIVNDSTNWQQAFIQYNDSTNLKEIFSHHKDPTYLQRAFIPTEDSLIIIPIYNLKNSVLHITLINSGVIFNSTDTDLVSELTNAQYLSIKANIEFIEIGKSEWADFQFCMKVPINVERASQELYLGFSFPVKNIYFSKFWIPALNWRSGSIYRDPISKLKSNNLENELEKDQEYEFKGVYFSSSARLMQINMQTKDASIIGESLIEKNNF